MTISIKNLRLHLILGVSEKERKTVREVVLNLTLDYDGGRAAGSDSLADALDYKALRDRILAVTKDTNYHLLEALAERICGELRKDTRIDRFRLEIDKPGALRLADSVSVATSWQK